MSLLLLSGSSAASPVPDPPVRAALASTISTAASSALQLADLALVWGSFNGDLTVIDSDLAVDRGLATAVLLSLFTDRRCEDDDVPSSGDTDDRRGWWADQFSDVEGDRIGSRLWLLDRSTITNEAKLRAEEYVREATAWMIEDGVAESIDVALDTTTRDLLVSVTPIRGSVVSLRFSHVWNSLQEAM